MSSKRKRELDSELADIFGGGKKKKKSKGIAVKRKKKRRDYETESESDESDFSSDESVAPLHQPVKKRLAAPAAAEAAESESDDVDTDFSGGYGSDLYRDDEDQRRLAAMPELQREDELLERHQRRQAWKERRQAKMNQRAARKQQRTGRAAKTRSTRVTSKEAALTDLKRRRAEQSSKARRKAAADSDYSPESGDEDDDDVAARRAQHRGSSDDEDDLAPEPESPWATMDQLNQIRLTRVMLHKWLYEPFFETLVPGFIVKIGVGSNASAPQYRVALIKSVKNDVKYTLDNKPTSKYLVVQIPGQNEKQIQMKFVSNHTIRIDEYNEWIERMQAIHKRFTQRDVEKQEVNLRRAKNWQYSNADIDKALEIRGRVGRKYDNPARVKIELMSKITRMQEAGDEEGAQEAAEELREVEQQIDDAKRHQQKRFDSLEEINRRNRERNIDIRLRKSVISAAAARKAAAGGVDAFARRRTDVGSGIVVPNVGASKQVAQDQKKSAEADPDVEPIPREAPRTVDVLDVMDGTSALDLASSASDRMARELVQAHDFDLGLRLVRPSRPLPPIVPASSLSTSTANAAGDGDAAVVFDVRRYLSTTS